VAPGAPHLAGVTVLDLSSVGPASRASRILADYGADVIKVSPTSAKGGVQIQPPFYSYGAGRGMKRLRVDLKSPDGKAAFLHLASRSDVLIESFRPGVVARMGIGYDDVRKLNQSIVYCSTSGYGQDGPRAKWAGHDLNYLAVSGYLHCSGRRADGGPALPGATVADSAAGGMHAAIAILAALLQRKSTGLGEYLDVSVADGALQLMSLHIDRYLATGEEPGPSGDILTGRYACYDVYAARDGKWLSVAAIEPAFFANLCRALGCEQWLTKQMDDASQEAIRADLRHAFLAKDRDQWVDELASKDTCIAPVATIPELVDDPAFIARSAFANAEHAKRGRFRQVGPVLAGPKRDVPTHRVADAAASESTDVLANAGMTRADIERLRTQGIIE
jgi:alpha-methylacyl-CoA racemase